MSSRDIARWSCSLALALIACSGVQEQRSDVVVAPEPVVGADWSVPTASYVEAVALVDEAGVHATFTEATHARPEGLVVVDGSEVVLRNVRGEELARREVRETHTLVAHRRGIFTVSGQRGGSRDVLRSLDRASLLELWRVDDVDAELAFTERYAVVVQKREDLHYLVEIDLATGAAHREMTLTGRVLGPVMQDGMEMTFFAFDEEHEIAEGEGTVALERIDLSRWTRTSIDVGVTARHYDPFAALRLMAPDGQTRAFVMHVGNGELVWVDGSTNERQTRSFPEEGQVGTTIVQLGPSFVLRAGGALHVFRASDGEHGAVIRFPKPVRRIASSDHGVWIDIERHPLELVPGDAAVRVERVRTEPWRSGDPGLAIDGDPSTVWRFHARTATVQFVFESPVVVPALHILTTAPRPDSDRLARASVAYSMNEFSGHIRQTRVEFDPESTEPQALIRDIRVARRVIIEITCATRLNGEGCEIAEIGF